MEWKNDSFVARRVKAYSLGIYIYTTGIHDTDNEYPTSDHIIRAMPATAMAAAPIPATPALFPSPCNEAVLQSSPLQQANPPRSNSSHTESSMHPPLTVVHPSPSVFQCRKQVFWPVGQTLVSMFSLLPDGHPSLEVPVKHVYRWSRESSSP